MDPIPDHLPPYDQAQLNEPTEDMQEEAIGKFMDDANSILFRDLPLRSLSIEYFHFVFLANGTRISSILEIPP